MLNVYTDALVVAGDAAKIADEIERKDRDLANQLRRAASSVCLNVAEGGYSRGNNRWARYHSAQGSARETLACAEVAVAMGYVREVDSVVIARMNRVVGALVRVGRGKT